jgi:hypothetical protein
MIQWLEDWGVMAAYLLALVLTAWSLGCAVASLERFDPVTGEKICEIWSGVVGTGETEQVTNACGDYAYATKDTGISDNGKAALGMVAEGAARGIMPLP